MFKRPHTERQNHRILLQIYSLLLSVGWTLLIDAWDKVAITVCIPSSIKITWWFTGPVFFHRLWWEYRRGSLEFWEQMEDRFSRLSRLVAIVPIVLRCIYCLLCCIVIMLLPSLFILFSFVIPSSSTADPHSVSVCVSSFTLEKGVCGLWLPPAVGR